MARRTSFLWWALGATFAPGAGSGQDGTDPTPDSLSCAVYVPCS